MPQETFEKRYTVEGIPSVNIGNVHGQVTVQPGEAGEVSITAVKHEGERADRTEIEIWQEADGSVHARARQEESGKLFSLWNRPARVDFSVRVPPEVNLAVKCVSADLEVHGLRGELQFKSVSGRIAAREVAGKASFESVSGRILGEKVSGALKVRTVSGKVTLKDSDLPTLTATSVSGAMDLHTPLGEGPYHLKTVSGSVMMRVPEEAGGRVHFKSISGRARFSQEVVSATNGMHVPGAPRNQTYDLGGDGPEISFNSVSGSLNLIGPEDDSELAQAPAEEEPAPQPSNRLAVLERIASGEMSVEDGIAAMKT